MKTKKKKFSSIYERETFVEKKKDKGHACRKQFFFYPHSL